MACFFGTSILLGPFRVYKHLYSVIDISRNFSFVLVLSLAYVIWQDHGESMNHRLICNEDARHRSNSASSLPDIHGTWTSLVSESTCTQIPIALGPRSPHLPPSLGRERESEFQIFAVLLIYL